MELRSTQHQNKIRSTKLKAGLLPSINICRHKATIFLRLRFEIVSLGFILYSILLHKWAGIPLRDFSVLFEGRSIYALYPYPILLMFVFLLIYVLQVTNRRSSEQPLPLRHHILGEAWAIFRARYFNLIAIGQDLRMLLWSYSIVIAFVNLKHLVPFVNPNLYDSMFQKIDKWCCFFLSPRFIYLHFLPDRTCLILGAVYALYFPFFIAAIFIFLFYRKDGFNFSKRFFFAFIMNWVISLFLIQLLPSVGPIYYYPEWFSHLPKTTIATVQEKIARLRELALQNPHDSSLCNLISGFPSLHISIVLTIAWYARYVNKYNFIFCVGFSVFTWIATLYFGWHYLVDDLAAVGVTAISICLSYLLDEQRSGG